MKLKWIFRVGALACAMTATIMASGQKNAIPLTQQGVQAIADGTIGINCYCKVLTPADVCSCNGSGSVCASFPGNGQCAQYDGNCR